MPEQAESGAAAPRRTTSMEASTQTAQLESFNPATGERIGSVPTIEPGDVQAIVDDVATVQPFWAQLPLADRGRYMRRAAQAIIDDLEDIATLLSREQGKPINEAYVMELLPTIDALHWIADNGEHILRDERIKQPQIFFKQKRAWFSY